MTTTLTPPSEAAVNPTFYLAEQAGHDHGEGGGGTFLGFWIYLMSDALIFATLFATYGVLSNAYAGGPRPQEIFELPLSTAKVANSAAKMSASLIR